jgi:hypothetical protein
MARGELARFLRDRREGVRPAARGLRHLAALAA